MKLFRWKSDLDWAWEEPKEISDALTEERMKYFAFRHRQYLTAWIIFSVLSVGGSLGGMFRNDTIILVFGLAVMIGGAFHFLISVPLTKRAVSLVYLDDEYVVWEQASRRRHWFFSDFRSFRLERAGSTDDLWILILEGETDNTPVRFGVGRGIKREELEAFLRKCLSKNFIQ